LSERQRKKRVILIVEIENPDKKREEKGGVVKIFIGF
jgi:hypothetical protein